MALPTMAQWTDAWARLNVYPTLGEIYASGAHIFRAMGIPQPIPRGQVRVNWTSGATAATVGTTAGAPSTAAPIQVATSNLLDFAAIAGQAYEDLGQWLMGSGFEASVSLQGAMNAIYRKFIDQLTGSADGNDYELWGLENFFDEANVVTAGMVDESGGTYANILKEIDAATAALPDTGYNICITDKQGYNAVKAKVRALGGTNPEHTSFQDFGFRTLMYDGVAFFHTDQMPAAATPTCPTTDSQFDFINIGPEGAQLLVPDGEPAIKVQGPKTTVGQINEVWDIYLGVQVVYASPRAAYKLITDIA